MCVVNIYVCLNSLSGLSPFRGETEEETLANIETVHYDVHQLYYNVTKYAVKFICHLLCRNAK